MVKNNPSLVKCEFFRGFEHFCDLVPACRFSIVLPHRLHIRVNFYQIANWNDVVSGISISLSPDANELWILAIHSRLLFQFSYHCLLRIFSVVYMTARKGITALDSLIFARNEHNLVTVRRRSHHESIGGNSWKLVWYCATKLVNFLFGLSVFNHFACLIILTKIN